MVWGFEGEGKTTVPLRSEMQYPNLKEYFAAHPELAKKYRNNVQRYINLTNLKLRQPVGFRRDNYSDPLTPLEDHEWPVEFRTSLPKERTGNLKSLLDMGGNAERLVVDQVLKQVIERLEPDTHQFRPVRVTTFGGEDIPGEFYTLVIGQFIDSFSPDQSDPKCFTPTTDPVNNEKIYKTIGGKDHCLRLALSRSAFGDAHLWRERRIQTPNVFMSNDLLEAIKDAGLKIPTFFKMNEGL